MMALHILGKNHGVHLDRGCLKMVLTKHSSSAQPTVENSYIHIDIKPESPPSPSSSKEMSLPKEK